MSGWETQETDSWLSTEPEYLNVLGPSAKVKGRGPEIRQSSGLEQKTVYVVAVRSYYGIVSTCADPRPTPPTAEHPRDSRWS